MVRTLVELFLCKPPPQHPLESSASPRYLMEPRCSPSAITLGLTIQSASVRVRTRLLFKRRRIQVRTCRTLSGLRHNRSDGYGGKCRWREMNRQARESSKIACAAGQFFEARINAPHLEHN